MNFVSKALFTLGFLLLVFGLVLIFERHNSKRLEFQNLNLLSKNPSKVYPTEILINDLKIHLPIYPSEIKNNRWETTTKGVSYLTYSPIPGSIGNSIIYGHNYENLFGPLTKIKPGEEIKIIFADKSIKSFKVKYTQTVTPDQTHILNQTKDKRITVYTCTGFLDLKRFVAVAILKEV